MWAFISGRLKAEHLAEVEFLVRAEPVPSQEQPTLAADRGEERAATAEELLAPGFVVPGGRRDG